MNCRAPANIMNGELNSRAIRLTSAQLYKRTIASAGTKIKFEKKSTAG